MLAVPAAEIKASEMVEELLDSDEARVVPAHVIFGNLAEQMERVEKTQQTHVREAIMRLFRGEQSLHVTACRDRVKFGGFQGENREAAVLNPAAILEIKLLFGVEIFHGRWVRTGNGDITEASNPIRPAAPQSIADYMRGRKVDKLGIVQANSVQGQNQAISCAGVQSVR
jgi:hypothetical protein